MSPLPFAMSHAQSVVIDDMIFVGGGLTNEDDGVNHVLFKYSPKSNTWIVLPGCPVIYYGLSTINGHPVIVGGKDISLGGKLTGECYVFEPETDEWKKSIPAMKTPRYSLTVASYGNYLVACGGKDCHDRPVKCVEIYNSKDLRWYIATDLPYSANYLTHTIIDEHLHIGTDDQHAAYTSLDNITHTSIKTNLVNDFDTSSDDDDISLDWVCITNSPMKNGSLMRAGYLLSCVGGEILEYQQEIDQRSRQIKTCTSWKTNTSIYFYQPLTQKWDVLLSDILPLYRSYCCTASLFDDTVYILGGKDQSDDPKMQQLSRPKARKEVFQLTSAKQFSNCI